MKQVSRLWVLVQAWLDQQQFPPSQAQLARAVGVQRSAVSDWKSGKTRPTPENLNRLAILMQPTCGPKTYTQLVLAVLGDMGFGLVESRLPDDFEIVYCEDEGYGQMRNLLPENQRHLVAQGKRGGDGDAEDERGSAPMKVETAEAGVFPLGADLAEDAGADAPDLSGGRGGRDDE